MFKNYTATIYDNFLITDIFKRISFSDSFKNSSFVFEYTIKDEDSIMSMSYNYYNTTEYVWYILSINDIQNYFKEYPIKNNIINEFIEDKYPTSSLILNPRFLYENNINLSKITHIGNDNNKYSIKNYNKSLCKLVTNEQIPEGISNFEFINEIYVYLDTGEKILIDKDEDGFKLSYLDSFSVHHFEYDQEIVDPFSNIPGTNISFLESFANNENEKYAIINYSYEIKNNDDKRKILFINSDLISTLNKQYKQIMSGIKKDTNVLNIPSYLSNIKD